RGVLGACRGGIGVTGRSVDNEGVCGQAGNTASSVTNPRTGVHGVTNSANYGAVWGEHVSGGDAVRGTSTGNGVFGASLGTGSGVVGFSAGGAGALARGQKAACRCRDRPHSPAAASWPSRPANRRSRSPGSR
ncbi:MAG TPA: hypothetical protein VF921_17820, partial [Vicinamibacterales bacterium]